MIKRIIIVLFIVGVTVFTTASRIQPKQNRGVYAQLEQRVDELNIVITKSELVIKNYNDRYKK